MGCLGANRSRVYHVKEQAGRKDGEEREREREREREEKHLLFICMHFLNHSVVLNATCKTLQLISKN